MVMLKVSNERVVNKHCCLKQLKGFIIFQLKDEGILGSPGMIKSLRFRYTVIKGGNTINEEGICLLVAQLDT